VDHFQDNNVWQVGVQGNFAALRAAMRVGEDFR